MSRLLKQGLKQGESCKRFCKGAVCVRKRVLEKIVEALTIEGQSGAAQAGAAGQLALASGRSWSAPEGGAGLERSTTNKTRRWSREHAFNDTSHYVERTDLYEVLRRRSPSGQKEVSTKSTNTTVASLLLTAKTDLQSELYLETTVTFLLLLSSHLPLFLFPFPSSFFSSSFSSGISSESPGGKELRRPNSKLGVRFLARARRCTIL